MATIETIDSGDTGLVARTKINNNDAAVAANTLVNKIFGGAGQLSACSLMEGGMLIKRGYGLNYNLGNGYTTTLPFASVALLPEFLNKTITKVVGSQESNYLLTESGEVWFWGYNASGQSGLGDTTKRKFPAKIQYFADNGITIADVVVSYGVDNVAGGNYENWENITAYFLATDGKIYGCGYNGYGQLGQNNTTQLTIITPIEPTKTFLKIVAGSNKYTSFFAIDDANDLWSCGYNSKGQLGLATTGSIYNLTKVILPEAVDDVKTATGKVESTSTATAGFTAVRGASGAVYTAGWGANGQQGSGTTAQRTSFAQLTSLGVDNASIFINYGGYYGTAGVIKTDGSVKIWGDNAYGNLGNGTTIDALSPISIVFNNTSSTVIKVVAAGTRIFTTFAFLFEDGTVETTGYTSFGQRGKGDVSADYLPAIVKLPKNIIDVASYGFGSRTGFVFHDDKGAEYLTGYSSSYYVVGENVNVNIYAPTLIRH
jgi:alpha-tubulin suppressor-like RCC1 family protein